MCIIIVKKPGADVTKEEFQNCAENNGDGFGLAFVNNQGKLETHRTMDAEAFLLLYTECLKECPEATFLLHFRKNTAGENTEANCHPFKVNKNLVMMHNGTIYSCDPGTKSKDKRSDSRIFAEDYLSKMPKGWENTPELCKMVEKFIGAGSKLVTLNTQNQVTIINEKDGHWDKGRWMSNYSYYPNTRSIQKYKPVTHTRTYHHESREDGPAKNARFHIMRCKGQFYRRIHKKTYKWDYTTRVWRVTDDNTGYFVYGQPTYYDLDPIKHKDNCIFVDKISERALYNQENDQKEPYLLEHHNAKPEHFCGECEWCGKILHRDNLRVVAFKSQGTYDHSIMCLSCMSDMQVDNTMYGGTVLPSTSLDAFLRRQIKKQGGAI